MILCTGSDECQPMLDLSISLNYALMIFFFVMDAALFFSMNSGMEKMTIMPTNKQANKKNINFH